MFETAYGRYTYVCVCSYMYVCMPICEKEKEPQHSIGYKLTFTHSIARISFCPDFALETHTRGGSLINLHYIND